MSPFDSTKRALENVIKEVVVGAYEDDEDEAQAA